MAKLLSGRVLSDLVDDTFIKLEEVDPGLGAPGDSNSIVLAQPDGTRNLFKLDSGFAIDDTEGSRKVNVDLSRFSITSLSDVNDSDGEGVIIDGGKTLIFSAALQAFVPSASGVPFDSSDAVTLNGQPADFYLNALNHNNTKQVFDSEFRVFVGEGNVGGFTADSIDVNKITINDDFNITGSFAADSLSATSISFDSSLTSADGSITLTSGGISARGGNIHGKGLEADSSAHINNLLEVTGNITFTGSITGNGGSLTSLTAGNLTGFVPVASISNSAVLQHQDSITGTGALVSGSIDSTFGDINIGTSTFTGNGSGLTNLDAANITGTFVSGNIDSTFGDINIGTNIFTGDGSGLINVPTSDSALFADLAGRLESDGFNQLFQDKTTTDLTEGTNLYYLTSRVDSDLASGVITDIASTNLTLTGNLTVTGTTTSVNTTTLEVTDPLLHLAVGNESSDVVDIGFLGHYGSGTDKQHTGFFRDASNSEYYLFSAYLDDGLDSDVPVNVIDRSDSSFTLATLNVGKVVGEYAGFDSDFGLKTTDDLTEGSTNLYFDSAFIPDIVDSAYVQNRANEDYIASIVDSGFIAPLARSAFSAGSGLVYDSSIGEFSTLGAPQADNALLLDSIAPTSFLRSDVEDSATARITFAANTKHTDGSIAYFGNEDDLQIYHSGGEGIIYSTSDINIKANTGVEIQAKNGEASIIAYDDSSVELYYDNSRKLETTTDGITVSGDLVLDGGGNITTTPSETTANNDSSFVVDEITVNTSPTVLEYTVMMTASTIDPVETQVSKVLIAFNGDSNVVYNEYGILHTGDSDLGTLTADYFSQNNSLRLQFARRSTKGTISVKPSKTVVQ